MVNINNNILNNIEKYCKINNIENIDKIINQCLEKGFNILRFGNSPFERMEMEKNQQIPISSVTYDNKKQELEITTTRKEKVDVKVSDLIDVVKKEETIKEEIKTEEKPKRKYTKKVRIIKHE